MLLGTALHVNPGGPMLIGTSASMEDVRMVIRQVADTDCSVLILGESGTGKEVVAQTIHRESGRKGAFVAVNCGAIPPTLLESELFGHERGAFTNATATRVGRFEQAHGGTLFLDEIGEMSPELQVKLLRAVQQRAFERVGGTETIRVDVRIVSATNHDLEQAVEKGRFRTDLYYRLNVISVQVPALRERRSDVPILASYFLGRLSQRRGYEVEAISAEATGLLQGYDWPGNVRQLENVLERAVVLKRRGTLEVEDFPDYVTRLEESPPMAESQAAMDKSKRCEFDDASRSDRMLDGQSLDSCDDRQPKRFFQLNMHAVNASLRGFQRQIVAVVCLVGMLGASGGVAGAAMSTLETRAEAQAGHWLERALPEAGAGTDELQQGVQKFAAHDYVGALSNLRDARRLGTGTPVEEAAAFLAGENRARAATTQQDVRAAILALEEARRKFPQSTRAAWALWRIGSLYRRLGLDHEAMARFEQLLRQEPASSPLGPFVRLDLADVYIAQGRYGPAARILRLIREHPPDSDSLADATVGSGDVSHALGQYRQAREFYETVEAQWPKLLRARPGSLLGMGDSYLRLGQWPRALQVLSTGYALYPRDPAAPMMLARLADGLKATGQGRPAKDLYQTIRERHPGTEGELIALVGLGELAEAEVHAGVGEKEAQEIYTAILRRWKSRPAAAEALFRLGQSHQRAGEFEDAAVAYDELLSRPNSTAWQRPARKALESTLRSLSAAGKFVEVANLYLRQEPVLSSPVVDGSTGLLVAGAFSRLGLIDSAIALIQASIAAGVSNAQHEYALVALAEAYRKKGDSQGLESAWKEYLRKFPAGPWSAEARQGLIIALSRVGKQDEAEKTCRAYVEQSRDPAARGDKGAVHEIMLVCADLFVQAGQLESAQHLYRQILKTEEDSVDGAWATYQLGRASRLGGRAGQADEYWERVARTDKDFLLAAVASAQLTGVGGSQRP